jgi:TolA-binding protein
MIHVKAVTIMVLMACAGVLPWTSMAAESSASAEKVAKEARETIEATKEYTVQQKEAFQKKVREELAAIQREITRMRGKLTKASRSTRAELQQSLDELEKKKRAAKDKLDELQGAGDAKWHEVKEGMNAALDELTRSYRKLLSHMP